MIWCVDDDNTIREIEVYTLTQTGFQARGFADGISMLDLFMLSPERDLMDGDNACDWLKKQEAKLKELENA